MIKIENIKTYGWEAAIRGMRSKGYRTTESGKFETFINHLGQQISLGTFDSEEEAENAVLLFRKNRLIESVRQKGLLEKDGKIIMDNYMVFPNGMIFNLHGHLMRGCVDRCGYKEVMLNGKFYRVHRVVAEAFIQNPRCCKCVNHKDGNKLNNDISNLEWCTRSENTIHAYNTGLEKKVTGENHHAHKLSDESVKYIRDNYKKGSRQFGTMALGRMFGVDKSTIRAVVLGETWKGESL